VSSFSTRVKGSWFRKGESVLVVVGSHPGSEELSRGEAFVGPTGRFLRKFLETRWAGGIYATNAVPYAEGAPSECYDEVLEEVRAVSPVAILALGPSARAFAMKAAKELGVPWETCPNPASALEGHVPMRRWRDQALAAILRLKARISHGNGLQSVSEGGGVYPSIPPLPARVEERRGQFVALDVECRGHPCDGFDVAALYDGQSSLVTQDPKEILSFVRGRPVVMHHAVHDLIALRAKGVDLQDVHCSMTRIGLYSPGGSRDLDVLASKLFGIVHRDPPYRDFQRGKIPPQEMGEYALEHAKTTWLLWDHLESRKGTRKALYDDVYRPLLPVLASMSKLMVDTEGLERAIDTLTQEADSIYSSLRSFADINWLSQQQVAKYFENKGVPLEKTEKGNPSVSEGVLQRLDLPEAKLLLRFREIKKLLSTYLIPMREKGCVTTVYDPVGARTGRMSSRDMNVQNIPPFVRSFIVPPNGKLWLEADYRSAEYAVAAWISGDRFMKQALESGDIHGYTARMLVQRDCNEDERRAVKAITFGLLYLAMPDTIAEYVAALGGDASAVEDLWKRWWDLHAGYAAFVGKVGNSLKRVGLWTSPLGRVFLREYPGPLRFQEVREIVNAVIQGTTSDITSMALLALSKKYTPLVVVHDSVDLAVDSAEAAEDVEETMRNVYPGISEYLGVKVEVKTRWVESSPS
jgi:DNA polymerase I-like protein with 3'-5' exonuclease and polymerase domains